MSGIIVHKAGGLPNHNDTHNIQGGTPTERYHVTQQEGVHVTNIAGTKTTVATTATVTVDTFPINTYRTIKWIVCLEDTVNSNYFAYELMVIVLNGSFDYTQYAKVGNKLSHTINLVDTGTVINLNITNNELSDFQVTVSKIALVPA